MPPFQAASPSLAPDWHDVLGTEKSKDYFQKLTATLAAERQAGITVYPPAQDVFSAFSRTAYSDVKVVILGQDPYHGAGQAHGLAFSVRKGVPIPPSLANIYKELADDIPGFRIPSHGCLNAWADRGVLLLNTVLTVEEGKPQSHKALGWERFTDTVIRALDQREKPIVFLLWGASAGKKIPLIRSGRHPILTAPHPSPLSAYRGFFGCRHFSETNRLFQEMEQEPVDWHISNDEYE